ncbi:hypothetical protein KR054_004342, partial [Drosophila jambulina]
CLSSFQITAILASSELANAFWWPKTTTESPGGGQVLQQIPLTYFRTYTYQPLAPGSAFSLPFFGFGAAQTPLLPGPQFDPYAVTSYAAARRHDTAARPDVTPPVGTSTSTTTTTTPVPTTTTTTTTTPAPTTTTTTSTTTPPPPSPPPPAQQQQQAPFSEGSSPAGGSSLLRYGGEYPTYSRRVSNLYNARPQYPYPDYFNYQAPQNMMAAAAAAAEQGASGTRIQFVPCMCPISVPSVVAAASPPAAVTAPPLSAASPSSDSQPAARHIERHSQELEADADSEADSDNEEDQEEEDQEQDQEEGASKTEPEPLETTPDSPV